MAEDDEHADMVAEALEKRGEQPQSDPDVSEWSLSIEMLARLNDAIQQLTHVTMAAGGAKKLPKFVPVRRPSTGVERALHRRRLAGNRRVRELMAAAGTTPQPGDPGTERLPARV
jgi:hypothetical protein